MGPAEGLPGVGYEGVNGASDVRSARHTADGAIVGDSQSQTATLIIRLSVATAGPRCPVVPGRPAARPPPKLREFPPPAQRATRREDWEGNRIGVNAAPDAETRLRSIRLRPAWTVRPRREPKRERLWEAI